MTPEAAAVVLNVPVDASREQIERAYRSRARLTHPDRFAGSPPEDIAAANAEFARVNEARDVLVGALEQDAAYAHAYARWFATEQATAPERPSRERPSRERPLGFDEFVKLRDATLWMTTDPGIPVPERPVSEPTPQAPREPDSERADPLASMAAPAPTGPRLAHLLLPVALIVAVIGTVIYGAISVGG